MSDEFKDKFMEVGGLWPTKSGKGYSGKVKVEIDADTKIYVFDNDSPNPKAPKKRMYIERTQRQETSQRPPNPPDDEEVPF